MRWFASSPVADSGRTDQQHEELAVRGLEVALAELRELAARRRIPPLDVREVEWGRGTKVLVVAQDVRERVGLSLLPRDAALDPLLDLVEVLRREVEAAELADVLLLLVGAVLDRLHQVAREPPQPGGQVVGEAVERVGVVPVEDHREVRDAVELGRDGARRLHARCGVGEELLEPGPEVEVELRAVRRGDGRKAERGDEHEPPPPHEPRHEDAANGPGVHHDQDRPASGRGPPSGSSRQPSPAEW